jgi:serine/threonine protein phosphatase PrpC
MENTSETPLETRRSEERGPARALVVSSHGLTDLGQQRRANEDQFVIAEVRRMLKVQQSSIPQPESLLGDSLGQLLMVADGIGGNRGGDVASTMAVMGIENLLLNTLGWLCRLHGEGVLRELHQALRAADRWVEEAAGGRPDLHGMGTTLTMGYVTGTTLYLAHAGDSRCYRWRLGRLERLTQDHTLVQRLVNGGVLTAAAAEHHELRNVVTNAVGGGTTGVEPEVHKHSLAAGDIVLLCTDGLTGLLSDEEIAAVLARGPTPAETCHALVDEANRRGGPDNITVVIARFDDGPPPPASA